MYLTEKEYQKKICQQRYSALMVVILTNKEVASVDGVEGKVAEMSICHGSECANWRWEHSDNEWSTGHHQKKHPERRGFCGLAGVPK